MDALCTDSPPVTASVPSNSATSRPAGVPPVHERAVRTMVHQHAGAMGGVLSEQRQLAHVALNPAPRDAPHRASAYAERANDHGTAARSRRDRAYEDGLVEPIVLALRRVEARARANIPRGGPRCSVACRRRRRYDDAAIVHDDD